MFNYDKPSRIFPCILLTRNHMISSAIWNKQALVNFFQRPQIALALRVRAIRVFKKIYSCLFIPNCTRNHAITYTN